MKVFTTRFGDLDVAEEEIINFPEGILGFEETRKYIVLKMEEGNPLMWLQSLEESALAFVMIRPFEFNPAYTIDLSDKDNEMLKLEKPEDCDVFAIVVIPENPADMTANLQGPVVINVNKKIGKQVISNNPKHKIRHYVLKEMEKNIQGNQGGN